MKTHLLERVQTLSQPRDEVFPFFADASNLQTLTPPWLHFRILTPLPIEMREGALIDYRLRLRGIPIRWRTEISVWDPPYRFVDRQIRGPYKIWEHEHVFEDVDGATRMTDRVVYAAPGGAWIRRCFVDPEIAKIFDFRHEMVAAAFSGSATTSSSLPAS